MVRNFPSRESSPQNPLLSFTFIFAFVAAVLTTISFLCGVPKKKQRTSLPLRNREKALVDDETQTFEVRIEEKRDNHGSSLDLRPPPRETTIEQSFPDTTINKPLPLPPAMVNLRAASFHVRSNSNLSEKRKLSSSMSMRSLGGYKKSSKKDKRDKNKLKHEDSIWKKTIILGEKCRVPDDDEEGIVYDEKGMRIPTFRRKQHSGLLISRQSSSIESDDIVKEDV